MRALVPGQHVIPPRGDRLSSALDAQVAEPGFQIIAQACLEQLGPHERRPIGLTLGMATRVDSSRDRFS